MKLYTVAEVADQLHLHEKTVRRLISAGDLGSVRVGPSGGRILVADDQLATFVDGRRIDGAL